MNTSFSFAFMRLLVPNLAAVVDTGIVHRDWQQLQRDGYRLLLLLLIFVFLVPDRALGNGGSSDFR